MTEKLVVANGQRTKTWEGLWKTEESSERRTKIKANMVRGLAKKSGREPIEVARGFGLRVQQVIIGESLCISKD